jgi:hypothetical protein
MMGDRAVSTPIDVVLGLLFVGIAAGVVATAAPAPPPDPPQGNQPAVLGSTVTVSVETDAGEWTVRETIGGHLADAAQAGRDSSRPATAYREAVADAVTDWLATRTIDAQVIGYCSASGDVTPVRAGPSPPADRPVRATTYDLPARKVGNGTCRPTVVLRRWSP